MNAIQPYRPPLEPAKPRQQVAPQRKKRQSSSPRPYRIMALETTAKLTVNVVLCAAAVSSLVKLLPYHWSQQEKLQEIGTEFKLTEGRVNRLQTDFSRYFDPQQSRNVMQELSNRVEPGQRQVIWSDKPATEVADPE